MELAAALALLFLVWVAGALAQVSEAAGHPLLGPASPFQPRVGDAVFFAVVSGVVAFVVCLLVWLGIGWIRYVLLVFAALNALGFVLVVARLRAVPPVAGAIVAAWIALAALLFAPRVNAWVRAVR